MNEPSAHWSDTALVTALRALSRRRRPAGRTTSRADRRLPDEGRTQPRSGRRQ
ncbi:MAG: hypothetical protein ABIZ05_14130 [Pseudonocardiaceae bacterium]